MKDPRYIRHFTTIYIFWQGLRGIPAALTLFAAAAAIMPWWALDKPITIGILLGGLVLAYFANGKINDHYSKIFGEVKVDRERKIKVWAAFYPGIIIAMLIDLLLMPPVFLTGMYMGLAFAVYWNYTGREHFHYLLNTVALGSLMFIPLSGFIANGKPMMSVFLLVLGTLYLIGGLWEHQEMNKTIRSTQKQSG